MDIGTDMNINMNIDIDAKIVPGRPCLACC